MVESGISELTQRAKRIRRTIVSTIARAGSGHVAPALSCADIVTALYFHVLRVDPSDPKWPERDRFILSAGHKCMAQYAALAERGFFPSSTLDTYLQCGSILGGHPDARKIPGVDTSTGALGHGLPIGVGMALAAKMKQEGYRVFVLLGDGELDEGSVWEAAMAAAHYRLDNLIAIIDHNGLQVDGRIEDVMNITPIAEKWSSFGWVTREIDGHDIAEIVQTLDNVPFAGGKPSAVVARTVKGKGVSFMENQVSWHMRAPNTDEYETAMRDLA